MRKILLLIGIFSFVQLSAQETDTTYWRKAFEGSLSFNQASFSDNWTAGGVNSVGLNALLKYKANYLKGKHSWDNEIDLLFGYINSGDQGYRKNNDRLFLDTKYGYALSPKWNMFGSLNLLSQFAKGYQYEKDSLDREVSFLVSEFMAPGFITAAWGFEYVPKPHFKLRLSPFAPRLTVVRNKELYLNVENNYGVDIGETTRWEWLAFQLLAEFNKDLSETVNLNFRYMMYANYQTLELDRIDHRLDANLSFKIARYFNVILTAIIVYDYDQVDEIQFSEALGIGFVYTFKNYTED
ncbi:MAG: DUF3078 domain-containing protein [Cyclobacteriaceae bacterium]|nr:DUF3078 domain-containing protein [Cyclobacteriaceae bacterium]